MSIPAKLQRRTLRYAVVRNLPRDLRRHGILERSETRTLSRGINRDPPRFHYFIRDTLAEQGNDVTPAKSEGRLTRFARQTEVPLDLHFGPGTRRGTLLVCPAEKYKQFGGPLRTVTFMAAGKEESSST